MDDLRSRAILIASCHNVSGRYIASWKYLYLLDRYSHSLTMIDPPASHAAFQSGIPWL